MNVIDAVAHIVFGKIARKHIGRYDKQRTLIRKAGMGILIEQYIAQIYLLSTLMAILAGLLGMLTGHFLLSGIQPYMLGIENVHPLFMNNFNLIVSTGVAVLFALLAAYLTYYIFMSMPEIQANIRGSMVNQSLPHTTAYLYAMSRGGANLIDIMKSLAENYHIYGAAAEEVGLIVKDMECYGTDLLEAIERAGHRTPSKKFKGFMDGLSSVVTSGGDLTSYLKSKNDQYRLTASKEQKIFFETLGVMAEVYVSAFVAGPLFLITILVVLGLMSPASSSILDLVIYILIPAGTAIFLILLNSLTNDNPGVPDQYMLEKKLDRFSYIPVKSGGVDEDKKIKKMKYYVIFIKLTETLMNPLKLFSNNPSYTFIVSIPVAFVYLSFTIKDHVDLSSIMYVSNINMMTLAAIDGHIFVAIVILLAPFIIFYEWKRYRIRQIESTIPDFLDKLAGINEAGVLLVDAIIMSTQLKIGILHSEVKRLVNDISWGTKLDDALRKFEHRIRTDMTRRIITLIIKANETTSDVKSVLTIAATDADIQRQLKKERNAEMFVYVFIIYIAFMVFLFIVYILAAYFLPAMPASTDSHIEGMVLAVSFDLEKYTLLFFHAAMIQGFCSGMVAGKMGSGTILAGLKHSILMMSVAYIVFTLLI